MEKLKVLLTTALLTLCLVLVTPTTAMADPGKISNGNAAAIVCLAIKKTSGFPYNFFGIVVWNNQGECLKFFHANS